MPETSLHDPSAILSLYRDRVYALVLRLIGNPTDAEDVAQTAFLKAFRSLHTYDANRPLLSWLFKIAHNASLDFLRAKGATLESLDDPEYALDPADTKAGLDAGLAGKDRDLLVRRLVESLPPLYKEVMLLRHQEDLNYNAIAEILQIPEGTVKIRLFRARELLKRKLESVGLGPEIL